MQIIQLFTERNDKGNKLHSNMRDIAKKDSPFIIYFTYYLGYF